MPSKALAAGPVKGPAFLGDATGGGAAEVELPMQGKSGLDGESGWSLLGLGPRRCPEFEDQQFQASAGHPGAFEGRPNREFVRQERERVCGVHRLHHSSLAELVSTMRHFGGTAKYCLQEVERFAEDEGTHVIATLFFPYIVNFSSVVTQILDAYIYIYVIRHAGKYNTFCCDRVCTHLQVGKVVGLIDIDGFDDSSNFDKVAEPPEEEGDCLMMCVDGREASAGLEVSSPLAQGTTSASSSQNWNFSSIFEEIVQQQDPGDTDGEKRSSPKANADAEDNSPQEVLDDHSLLRLALGHRPHMEQPTQRGAKQHSCQSSKAVKKKQSSQAEAAVKKKPAAVASAVSNAKTRDKKQKPSHKATTGRRALVFPDQVPGERRDQERKGGWIRHVFVRGKGDQAGENYFEYSSPDGWRYRTLHAAEKNGYSDDV